MINTIKAIKARILAQVHPAMRGLVEIELIKLIKLTQSKPRVKKDD